MPFENIEDATQIPIRMWFSQANNNKWKPLRKCDCRALNLNDNPGEKETI